MISDGFDLIKLSYVLYVFRQAAKNVDPDQTPQNPGTLFATHPAILHTFTGNKME